MARPRREGEGPKEFPSYFRGNRPVQVLGTGRVYLHDHFHDPVILGACPERPQTARLPIPNPRKTGLFPAISPFWDRERCGSPGFPVWVREVTGLPGIARILRSWGKVGTLSLLTASSELPDEKPYLLPYPHRFIPGQEEVLWVLDGGPRSRLLTSGAASCAHGG